MRHVAGVFWTLGFRRGRARALSSARSPNTGFGFSDGSNIDRNARFNRCLRLDQVFRRCFRTLFLTLPGQPKQRLLEQRLSKQLRQPRRFRHRLMQSRPLPSSRRRRRPRRTGSLTPAIGWAWLPWPPSLSADALSTQKGLAYPGFHEMNPIARPFVQTRAGGAVYSAGSFALLGGNNVRGAPDAAPQAGADPAVCRRRMGRAVEFPELPRDCEQTSVDIRWISGQ